MKRTALMAMLMFPGVLLAAPVAASSTTGVWRVDGNVMGQPVVMTCTLTETEHVVGGSCAGAADNFTPHKVAGKVKAQAVELHFESSVQGTPISVIMSGTLNDDGSKVNGELDVEPMSMSGMFTAVRVKAASASAPKAIAQAAPPAAPPAAAAHSSTGTWKVDGDIQGTPVPMTCVITEADKKLTGTCAGAGDDPTPHNLTGDVTDKGVNWKFDSAYQGTPITISMAATLNDDGTKMNGTMSVAPMGVDGTFVAVKQ